MIQKTIPTDKYDCTENFDTQPTPFPVVVENDTYFFEPQYALDPHWDEDLNDPGKLVYKDTYKKPHDQIENDNLITDAHVSEALLFALID